MTHRLAADGLRRLFDEFEQTAFRLETRDQYVEESEEAPLRLFLSGEPDDYRWMAGWAARVRGMTESGARVERVRVVTEPLSDYITWSLHVARINVEAGEDIRYLERSRALDLGLPDEDYWLFDGARAAVFRFDEQGRVSGKDLVTEPRDVAQRSTWRDLAWNAATPWKEFAAQHGVD